MTVFEHALTGVDGALVLGLHRRHGWPIVAWAGLAATLPDWDGLTLVLGPRWYAESHRVWGHNLLVATLLSALLAWLVVHFDILGRTGRYLGQRFPILAAGEPAPPPTPGFRRTRRWILVGILATLSHLVADVLFSGHPTYGTWGVPLCWPFRSDLFAWPTVPWGDLGATLILAAGMFLMVWRPTRVQSIAGGTLAVLGTYMLLRAVTG